MPPQLVKRREVRWHAYRDGPVEEIRADLRATKAAKRKQRNRLLVGAVALLLWAVYLSFLIVVGWAR